jgi:hypothetical protein
MQVIQLCSSAALSQIHLLSPATGSVLDAPPSFTWSADSGANNVFAVDLALSPSGPIYSTYENLHQIISEETWTMPASIWNMIPAGRNIYWRVRGADLDVTPPDVIASDEVWTFRKQ